MSDFHTLFIVFVMFFHVCVLLSVRESVTVSFVPKFVNFLPVCVWCCYMREVWLCCSRSVSRAKLCHKDALFLLSLNPLFLGTWNYFDSDLSVVWLRESHVATLSRNLVFQFPLRTFTLCFHISLSLGSGTRQGYSGVGSNKVACTADMSQLILAAYDSVIQGSAIWGQCWGYNSNYYLSMDG